MIQTLLDRIQGKAPKGAKRSPKWRKVRNAHIKKFPRCAVCGSTKKAEVHHKIPFHIAPDLELNPKNIVTLCERKKWGITCHLLIGHLGNYRNINISVDEDIAYMRAKLGRY